MRILILTSRYPPLSFGGHGERCRQTAASLARRGHIVQVLTSNHRLPSQGLSGERGVRRRLILRGKPGEGFRQLLGRERANNEILHEALVRFRPDCVFVWEMEGLSKSLLFFLQDSGVPLLYDLHSEWLLDDFENDPWAQWWRGPASPRRALFRWFLRISGRAGSILRRHPVAAAADLDLAHAFACGEGLRNRLAAGGIGGGSLEVLPPATDVQLIPVKIAYGGNTRLMWAGRLSPEKDPDTAIEAVRILRERGRKVSLFLYVQGEQAERKMLRTRINELGMDGYIHIRHIRPADLSAHFSEFDALVSTSGADDLCPMTPLEAMLAGVPCIVARGSAVCDRLREDEHCLCFNFGDPESLVEALEKFCQKRDYGADMARRCRDLLQETGSLDTAIVEIESRLARAGSVPNHEPLSHVDDGNTGPARGELRPGGSGD